MTTTTTTEEHLHIFEETSCFKDVETQTDDQQHACKNAQSQTTEISDSSQEEINDLNRKVEQLTRELKQLQFKLQNAKFDIETFKDSVSDISFYTGFNDYKTLELCYNIIEESAKNMNYGKYAKTTVEEECNERKPGRPRKLKTFDEYILVLVKLRLGLFNHDLAHRFKISESSVSLTFRTWIRFLRRELEPLIRLPPREVIKLHMPSLFKAYYPNTAMIIDCTEFEMERPSALDNQSMCYSQYKSRTTMKGLIGITPSGTTAFVSELYPGST